MIHEDLCSLNKKLEIILKHSYKVAGHKKKADKKINKLTHLIVEVNALAQIFNSSLNDYKFSSCNFSQLAEFSIEHCVMVGNMNAIIELQDVFSSKSAHAESLYSSIDDLKGIYSEARLMSRFFKEVMVDECRAINAHEESPRQDSEKKKQLVKSPRSLAVHEKMSPRNNIENNASADIKPNATIRPSLGLSSSIRDLTLFNNLDMKLEKMQLLITFLSAEKVIQTEGIFRVNPSKEDVITFNRKLVYEMEKNLLHEVSEASKVHVVARILKITTQEMAFPQDFVETVRGVVEVIDMPEEMKKEKIIESFYSMSLIHQKALLILMEFLARVVENSFANKMDIHNLAIVFASNIFSPPKKKSSSELLKEENISREAFKFFMEVFLQNRGDLVEKKTRFVEVKEAFI